MFVGHFNGPGQCKYRVHRPAYQIDHADMKSYCVHCLLGRVIGEHVLQNLGHVGRVEQLVGSSQALPDVLLSGAEYTRDGRGIPKLDVPIKILLLLIGTKKFSHKFLAKFALFLRNFWDSIFYFPPKYHYFEKSKFCVAGKKWRIAIGFFFENLKLMTINAFLS